MVVSGLPERNGKNHAKEVALMALHFMKAIKTISIDHKNGCQLSIRAGINTGKLSSYSLFRCLINPDNL